MEGRREGSCGRGAEGDYEQYEDDEYEEQKDDVEK